MKSVKIIGVPEHFNYPWHMAIAEGAFEQVQQVHLKPLMTLKVKK